MKFGSCTLDFTEKSKVILWIFKEIWGKDTLFFSLFQIIIGYFSKNCLETGFP